MPGSFGLRSEHTQDHSQVRLYIIFCDSNRTLALNGMVQLKCLLAPQGLQQDIICRFPLSICYKRAPPLLLLSVTGPPRYMEKILSSSPTTSLSLSFERV